MYEYKDPSRLGTLATTAIAINLVIEIFFGLATWYAFVTAPFPGSQPAMIADLTAGLTFLAMLACAILVGMWIYRVTANAHCFSDEMTITPGWSVGWYFVPFANMVKPFQGMKEAWLASHFRVGGHGQPAPGLLGWWWALWLITNILSSISFRISLSAPMGAMSAPAVFIDVATALLNVPLSLILISMIRRLSRA
ncbi:MAG: DUF4328 domain-containing protein [Allosphingosinicella sp.]